MTPDDTIEMVRASGPGKTLQSSRPVPKKPFIPSKMGRAIEKSVLTGASRLYCGFGVSPSFGGSVKGFAVGCNLRCNFCWSPCRSKSEITRVVDRQERVGKTLRRIFGESVDQHINIEKELAAIKIESLNPPEVVERLVHAYETLSSTGIPAFECLTEGPIPGKIRFFTLTGGEPTLCRDHLLGVIEEYRKRRLPQKFLIQTHGFGFGEDPSYLEDLQPYAQMLEIRISFKAGLPEKLSERTGASADTFHLPFLAVKQLLASPLSFHLAAMLDSQLVDEFERNQLLSKLSAICSAQSAELVVCDSEETDQDAARNAGPSRKVYLDSESFAPQYPELLAGCVD